MKFWFILESPAFNYSYLGISLALIGRGIGVPIPEDIPLLTAGFLCARHICRLEWMLPLAWGSVLVADTLSFVLGRFFRNSLPSLPVIRQAFSPPRLVRADHFYRRHGLKGLLAARFMPGLRTPLFFIAGTARLPCYQFIVADMIMAAFSVSIMVGLGWLFPSQLDRLRNLTAVYKWILLALAAAAILLLAAWKLFSKR